ncbi:MAG: HDIG domain-containing protein [Desulfobacterales bacterium]|nr:HDIG domain-containing protein [Desulfobacterales bacterium]
MNLEKNNKAIRNFFASSKPIRWFILIGFTIIFTIILYPTLIITKHSYKLGDVAERDIKAPKDFLIEDEEATEENRKKAAEEVLTVYDNNASLSVKLGQNVKQSFAEMADIFEAYKESQGNASSNEKLKINSDETNKEIIPLLLNEKLWQLKESFEEKIGFTVSDDAYKILIEEKFSSNIAHLISRILTEIINNGVVINKDILLKESDKGIILRDVETKTEKIIYNLKLFYGPDQAKTMVRIIGQPMLKDMNYNSVNLIVDFVQKLIQPNITLNTNETEERKKRAVTEIKPVLYKIKTGEMLLREGEIITKVQLLKLKNLQVQTKKEHILAISIGAAMIILCLLVLTYILHINHNSRFARNHNKNLMVMACMLIIILLFARVSTPLSEALTQNSTFGISPSSIIFGIPIASGAMIICLFLGLDIAIPFALLTAACTAVIFQNRFEFFIYFLLNSSMAAYWLQNCRERKVFIKAGLKIGLLNVVLSTAIAVYISGFLGFKILEVWAFAFMGGIVAGIVTTGIAPIVEIAFGYTTDITLLELANLERPILRRLMIEAPGTYHHSVIVGNMVEAAATEIGANPLLAKACGYYHDIGKIKKPLYFIENQKNGKNKHNKLAPSMSKHILVAHVKEGVEMARQNKLGQAIIDTIRQHHGTSLISYFYEKAKKQKGEDAVEIDNFRYPGPKPQTKEAGLVMLADVVEAASRTLDNPTPSRIQGLVQNLINKIFSDGQIDNCELTLKDLHKIAKTFNRILSGIHHHRIDYPEKSSFINGKVKDESPDRQQAKKTQNFSGNNTEESSGHLKRLGLS